MNNTRRIAFCIGIVLAAAFFACATSAYAQGDIFETAKLCHAYTTGKLSDAYAAVSGAASETVTIPEELQTQIIEEYESLYPTQNRLNEEKKGLVAARCAYKKIITSPQTKNAGKEKPHFETTTTGGVNTQDAESSSDRSFDEKGYYLTNHMNLNYNDGNVDRRLDTDATGYRNSHQELRLRRGTYTQSNESHRFLLGDIETSMSRYVMRGTYYRGSSLSLLGDRNTLQCTAGIVPNYDIEPEEYRYERRIISAKDEMKVRDNWTSAVAFMDLKDKDSIRGLSDNYNPKENQVGSWANTFVLSPFWNIATESAYSVASEDRTKEDITTRDRDVRGNAHFIASTINWPTIQIINSYERLSYGFRSYTDISSDTSFYSALSGDKEIIYSGLNYTPNSQLFIGGDLSRVITNLSRKPDVDTLELRRYAAYAHYQLPFDLPRLNWRTYVYNNISGPGPDQAEENTLEWTHEFSLSKTLFDTDFTASYERKRFFDPIATYPDDADVYALEAAKGFFNDRLTLDARYSFETADEIVNGSSRQDYEEDLFNTNIGIQPFDELTLFLNAGYEWEQIRYYIAPTSHVTTQSVLCGFSWPLNMKVCGHDFTLSPSAEIIKSLKTDGTMERMEYLGRLEGIYFLKSSQLSLTAEYRKYHEEDDPYSELIGTKECRVFLTYRTNYDFK